MPYVRHVGRYHKLAGNYNLLPYQNPSKSEGDHGGGEEKVKRIKKARIPEEADVDRAMIFSG
jgi:hypothetical protein